MKVRTVVKAIEMAKAKEKERRTRIALTDQKRTTSKTCGKSSMRFQIKEKLASSTVSAPVTQETNASTSTFARYAKVPILGKRARRGNNERSQMCMTNSNV